MFRVRYITNPPSHQDMCSFCEAAVKIVCPQEFSNKHLRREQQKGSRDPHGSASARLRGQTVESSTGNRKPGGRTVTERISPPAGVGWSAVGAASETRELRHWIPGPYQDGASKRSRTKHRDQNSHRSGAARGRPPGP